ncbi:amino acid permease [bacterium]|nr:amino acid permease [bacterium]
MANPKKFGTFKGVFTPSILTILGVIMYMRLPWIVGQAGLFTTIGIILVAHIISITSGLSVSSIATDKKVKGGGTYFMISRSLGLPIGGTLGLALFIGLSFSVSLYLIGFSESMLSFVGLPVTKNTIRLAGSAALVLVTVITFISTSLALKTQFFILVAICLSLVSIFGGTPQTPAMQPNLYPIAGSASFIVLFGIFFPAVTGFEAGVSMSGDLQDPKRSIPLGTIAAIVVGLVVYIGIAVFFSFRVTASQLINDPNVLLNISFFSPLVIAGIWGATLSSALGSILGAPRILQAISMDSITPKFFGRGYGRENEPRNALLLTFLLAETGILIGELDVIARVVSMFFITTYGFLNLSCFIEAWASPDFHPDFRIPRWVSLLGAVTCLIVMIQLDLLAMIAATVLLSSLFFYLKRKELTLESGDTWEGVWSSLIRTGLQHLNRHVGQRRNWRPNIILFSGGTSARPHLIDLGKRLVDKRGVLSNFDLIETAGSQMMFRKAEQSVRDQEEEYPGVFSRRIACEDVYPAMETISKYYGFSGLEPNTILMGWGKNSQKPEKFVGLLRTMMTLDYNLMLLNYDEERAFGDHQRIDIWWRGLGNNFAFALSLCRFLINSDEWRDAEIRFLTITEDSSLTEKLFLNMNKIIEDYRIEATVKVINNAIEKRPFYEIIKGESGEADLTINGIPAVAKGEEQVFVAKNNSVIESLGTVLLIHASSFFDEMDVGLEIPPVNNAHEPGKTDVTAIQPENLGSLPKVTALSVVQLGGLLAEVNTHFQENGLQKLYDLDKRLLESVKSLVDNCFQSIEKDYLENERLRNHRTVVRALGEFLFQTQRLFSDQGQEIRDSRREILEAEIQWCLSRLQEITGRVPEEIVVTQTADLLQLEKTDSLRIRMTKLLKQLAGWMLKRPVKTRVQFRKLADRHVSLDYLDLLENTLSTLNQAGIQKYPDLQRIIDHVVDSLGKTGTKLLAGSNSLLDALVLEQKKIIAELDAITTAASDHFDQGATQILKGSTAALGVLVDELNRFDHRRSLHNNREFARRREKITSRITDIPDLWNHNDDIMMDTTIMDLNLLSFKNRVTIMVRRTRDAIRLAINNDLLDELADLSTYLEDIQTDGSKRSFQFKYASQLNETWSRMIEEIRTSINDLAEAVEIAVQDESGESPVEKPTLHLQTATVSLRRLVDYFFESEFFGPSEAEIAHAMDRFQKIVYTGKDVNRLISIHLNRAEDETEPQSMETAVNEALERVVEAMETGKTALAEFEQYVDERLKETFEKLNLYSLAVSARHLSQQIREQKGLQAVVVVKARLGALGKRFIDFNTRMIYRRASAVTYLKQMGSDQAGRKSDIDRLLALVETLSPRPEIVSQLPFYYRHLFLGKPVITKDFWLGRQAELLQADKALKRHQAGQGSGLAIVGEPGSGKTALSRYIASRYFDKQKIFQLNPPEQGSIEISLLEDRLRGVFEQRGGVDQILDRLPARSVLILDDISRWWERSRDGFSLIDRFMDWIKRYGDKCFFIVNLDSHSFKFMNQIKSTQHHFLDIISCSYFEIESLKKMVMMRHRSAGLKFSYRGKREDELNEWQMARLFTGIYQNCSGNLTAALHQWIMGITEVSRDGLQIDLPGDAHVEALNLLTADQWMFCVQFLLHGGLNRERLARIFQVDIPFLARPIDVLKRGGILTEKPNGVLQLNAYIQPFLLQKTIEKGLL